MEAAFIIFAVSERWFLLQVILYKISQGWQYSEWECNIATHKQSNVKGTHSTKTLSAARDKKSIARGSIYSFKILIDH